MRASLELTFAALADPTRRGVVGLLRRQPLRASVLADELGASKPAMSRHLKILRASGLIAPADESSEDKRERVYQLVPDPFAQLRIWLDDVEQLWTAQLDAFKEHVERELLASANIRSERRRNVRYTVPKPRAVRISERTRKSR